MRSRAIAVVLVALMSISGCAGGEPAVPAPTPSSVDFERDVVFRTVAGERLALDACIPSPRRETATLVLIHGGGFTSGNRAEMSGICTQAAIAGYAAFTVDYRLLPARYPAQAQDVAAAVEWLALPAQRTRFGLLSDHTALIGASAGAVVAAELAVGTPGSPLTPRRLSAVVLLSGIYDTSGPLGDLKAAAQQYLGCSDHSAECAERGREISAIHFAHEGDPPMMLLNSTDEVTPVEQPRLFARALQKAGVPHETVVVSGAAHAQAVFDTHPETAGKVLAFLQRYMPAPAQR